MILHSRCCWILESEYWARASSLYAWIHFGTVLVSGKWPWHVDIFQKELLDHLPKVTLGLAIRVGNAPGICKLIACRKRLNRFLKQGRITTGIASGILGILGHASDNWWRRTQAGLYGH